MDNQFKEAVQDIFKEELPDSVTNPLKNNFLTDLFSMISGKEEETQEQRMARALEKAQQVIECNE